MGTKNRERRRAKQRDRLRRERGREPNSAGGGRTTGSQSTAHDDVIDHCILSAALCDCGDPDHHRNLIYDLVAAVAFEGGPGRVAERLETLFDRVVAAALDLGWEPADLWHVTRRRVGPGSTALVTGALQRAVRRSAPSRRRDLWQRELDEPGEPGRSLDHRKPSWSNDVAVVVELIRQLRALPRMPDLGGAGRVTRVHPVGVDDRLLQRVRALLAKAESSEFEAEADSFMAKAQELMTRHRLDRALLEDDGIDSTASAIEARRCWLEDPYLPVKGFLLGVIARASRCQAVSDDTLGWVTIVGHPDDLDLTELLFTSLLVQATRRMTALGSGRAGVRDEAAKHARRPSFRRSFLLAFAIRIGKRLQEVADDTTCAAAEDLGDRLLPVLARQSDAVDRAVRQLFPNLVHTRMSASDGRGWVAGTAAADMADLGVRPRLGFPAEAAS